MGAAAAAHHQPTTLTGGLSVGFWHHRRIGPGLEARGRCRERRGMCDPPSLSGRPAGVLALEYALWDLGSGKQ